ncbi:hypothetical protein ABIA32_001727 [Streptacidiphilus sp. MAP12-20]|uniref:hypothetical protein n=1 Tax=Streptacidiphilus sp. MAP12-20 TaxID=3156299 RepID=UPI003518E0F8
MTGASGFSYEERGNGTVVVTHRGRLAAQLRGARAEQFLAELRTENPQLVMARWTGNYRRGNERTARHHPRNSG